MWFIFMHTVLDTVTCTVYNRKCYIDAFIGSHEERERESSGCLQLSVLTRDNAWLSTIASI